MDLNTGNLKVIYFPEREKTKREIAFERDMDYLMETIGELILVEKMTGRAGLPLRVCMAFGDALRSAVKLAGEQYGKAN